MTKTQVGHCKADDTDVYIGRGAGNRHINNTKVGVRGWLGNPHKVGEKYTREESIGQFRTDFEAKLRGDDTFREAVKDLQGKTLGCWCQRIDDDSPACHGEVIKEWVERLNDE